LQHWRELAFPDPLQMDWDAYLAMTAAGVLHVTTCRAGTVLVGYIFNQVSPHLHHMQVLHAYIDMFWLDPVARDGWTIMKIFRFNDAYLKDLGVKQVRAGVRANYMGGRVGLIFKRLGYVPDEFVYGKRF
jgi:hypothetical protein